MIKTRIPANFENYQTELRQLKCALFAADIPRIICLCGSTKFYKHFQKMNFELTMKGNIVLTVGFYPHAENEFNEKLHGETVGVTLEEKIKLDELHKRKIDLADEILVLNVGDYIGESTKSEIEHAIKTGKPIMFLEPHNVK